MASDSRNKTHALSSPGEKDLEKSKDDRTCPADSGTSGREVAIATGKRTALDGGWGWAVVFGSFLNHFIGFNVQIVNGMLYLYLLEKYDKGHTKTTVPFIINKICLVIGPPVYGLLAGRYGARPLSFIGSIMMATGLVASAWAPSLAWFAVLFGLLRGLGGGMLVTPSLIIVHQYFHHKKSLAIAMANLGISVALAFSPLISSFLLDIYGLKGTLMMLGALSLNGCVSGALFIPLKQNVAITKMDNSTETRKTMEHPSEGTSINASTLSSYHATLATQEQSLVNSQKLCDYSEVESPENVSKIIANDVGEDQYTSNAQRIQEYLYGICNTPFVLHCFLILGLDVCVMTFIGFLPGLVEELGYYHAPLLLTITGIMDTIGALLWGYVFDMPRIHTWRHIIFASIGIAWAALTAAAPHMRNLLSMVAFAVSAGVITGAAFGQRFALVSDCVERKYIPLAMGVSKVFQNVGGLIAYPVSGALTERSGTYAYGFYASAAVLGSIAVIPLVYHIYKKLVRTGCSD